MRLTKQTGHAIRILVACAQAGDRLVKVANISEKLGITKQNVFKIVHLLSRADFVKSVRGPSGGFRLARPSSDIMIGDIVRAMELTSMRVDNENGRHTQPTTGPTINSLFGDALTAFISVLDQHSLAELAGGKMTPPENTATKKKRRARGRRGSAADTLR